PMPSRHGVPHLEPDEPPARGRRSVSVWLEQQHGVKIAPGKKGTCPTCRHDTLSVSRDDTIGKCFHPACGWYVTSGSLDATYTGSLHQVLDTIKADCHKALVVQAEVNSHHAWRYITQQRGIHPKVVEDLQELGVVPEGYDV